MLRNEFVVTLIAVLSFAGLGTLIRVNLSILYTPSNAYSFLPNIVGSFILGLIKGSTLKNTYLVQGLGTGLCGSITTFSSFNHELNILIVNKQPDILSAFMLITMTFLGAIVSFYFGESASKYICTYFDGKPTKPSTTSTQPSSANHIELTGKPKLKDIETGNSIALDSNMCKETENATESNNEDSLIEENLKPIDFKRMLDWILVLILVQIIVIPLSFFVDDRLWLATLLAPFGAGLRWYLGLKLNRFNIPIGTLLANMVSALLLTSLLVVSHESNDVRKETIWIEAVTKGFCGCLSTVSSFVGELFALQRAEMSQIGTKPISFIQRIGTYKVSVVYFVCTICIAQILSAIPNIVNIWG